MSTAVGVLGYARAGDGTLTVVNCVGNANGCTPGQAIGARAYLGLSPDGTLLVSTGDGSINLLDRDPASGRLTGRRASTGASAWAFPSNAPSWLRDGRSAV